MSIDDLESEVIMRKQLKDLDLFEPGMTVSDMKEVLAVIEESKNSANCSMVLSQTQKNCNDIHQMTEKNKLIKKEINSEQGNKGSAINLREQVNKTCSIKSVYSPFYCEVKSIEEPLQTKAKLIYEYHRQCNEIFKIMQMKSIHTIDWNFEKYNYIEEQEDSEASSVYNEVEISQEKLPQAKRKSDEYFDEIEATPPKKHKDDIIEVTDVLDESTQISELKRQVQSEENDVIPLKRPRVLADRFTDRTNLLFEKLQDKETQKNVRKSIEKYKKLEKSLINLNDSPSSDDSLNSLQKEKSVRNPRSNNFASRNLSKHHPSDLNDIEDDILKSPVNLTDALFDKLKEEDNAEKRNLGKFTYLEKSLESDTVSSDNSPLQTKTNFFKTKIFQNSISRRNSTELNDYEKEFLQSPIHMKSSTLVRPTEDVDSSDDEIFPTICTEAVVHNEKTPIKNMFSNHSLNSNKFSARRNLSLNKSLETVPSKSSEIDNCADIEDQILVHLCPKKSFNRSKSYDDKLENIEQGVQCPICGQMFPMSVIEKHASECPTKEFEDDLIFPVNNVQHV